VQAQRGAMGDAAEQGPQPDLARAQGAGRLLGEVQLAGAVEHEGAGHRRGSSFASAGLLSLRRGESRHRRLSCQEQLRPGDSMERRWEFAAGAGFDDIELRARGDGHFAARLPELRAAARAGVVMATVCPETDHFIGDFDADRRRDATEQLRSQLSVIAELGGEGVLTPASWGMFSLRLPPFTPPPAAGDDRKVLMEALAEL